jgi:hypothetical protein
MDRQAVGDGEVVFAKADLGQRMRHIRDLIALSQPNDAREVVLDDAEVIAVIPDVSRQKQRVAPSDDALLAQVRRVPIDFERQLVGLEDLRGHRKPFPELREKGHVAMGIRAILGEPRIGELLRSASRRQLHDRPAACVIPVLPASRVHAHA